MWILDRYLLRIFVKVLFVSFLSLTGLFIVIDAFSNLDEFLKAGEQSGGLLTVLGEYYGARVLTFFDRTSGLLALVAAMFVITWLQRTNELTAILAAGISHRRVLKPILVAAAIVSVIAAVNREVGIPQVRNTLARNAQDLAGDRAKKIRPQNDFKTRVLLSGQDSFALDRKIVKPNFLLHAPPVDFGRKISANEAFYLDPTESRPGGYHFKGVIAPENIAEQESSALPDGTPFILTPKEYDWLEKDECFLVSEVSFEQLSSSNEWRRSASVVEMIDGLRNPSLDYGADVRVAIHARFLQPLLDLTLLLLGLPLVVSKQSRNVFIAAGYGLLVVAIYFLVVLVCQALGGAGLVSPTLAAWLPLLLLSPVAILNLRKLWDS